MIFLHCMFKANLLILISIFTCTTLLCAFLCHADEIEPRRWTHLPINTSFIGGGYAYSDADISFDPVLKIEDGRMELNTWVAKYIRTFSLLNQMARLDILQAYQEGRWSGVLDGTPSSVRRSGWADTLVRFAINLYGAPPLEGKEFVQYRAATQIETIVGAGLSIQLPTGDYMDDKLINLGTNRYTLRPQLGVIHSRGKWSVEATGYVTLYTDNDDFFNGMRLEQDALYVINGHLIYTLRPGFWVGASAGYDYGGRSTVDGTRKDDRKQDLIWALGCGFPVSRHLAVKMAYIGVRTQEATGIDADTLTVALSASW